MSELKSCPFCGGEAWMRISDAPQILRVECRRCHVATTSFVADSIGEKEAAVAWNTRHVETCKVESSYWDELINDMRISLSCGHDIRDFEPPKFCPECGRKVEG